MPIFNYLYAMTETVRMHIPEDLRMDDDEFFRFCQDNPDLKFERPISTCVNFVLIV